MGRSPKISGRGCLRTLAVMGAVALAYYAGARNGLRSAGVSSRDLDHSDLREAQRSFSDLENTRLELDHLAQEMALNVHLAVREAAEAKDPTIRHTTARRERAIRMLEQAIVELDGTDLQGRAMAELLPLLENAGRLDEWVNRFLELAYRSRDGALVLRRGADAARIGNLTGRSAEIAAALEMWDRIPETYRVGGPARGGRGGTRIEEGSSMPELSRTSGAVGSAADESSGRTPGLL